MATLHRLTVRGFKSIRSLEEFEVRGINVLIGANGAGKSNLLDVFRSVSELASGRWQVHVKQEGGADALLYGGRRKTPNLEIALSFDRGHYCYGFSAEAAGDDLVLGREWLSPGAAQAAEPLAARRLLSGRSSGWSVEAVGDNPKDLAIYRLSTYALSGIGDWRVYHFGDTSRVSGMRCPQEARDNLRLKADGSNLAPFLRFLRERHPRRLQDIVETVRIAAPFFGDFVYRKDVEERVELEWYHRDDRDTPLGPGQISDGLLRFVCVATVLLQPPELQPDPIMIDEPELGLHPLALGLLAEMVRRASDARRVIVSTQSADLVSEFEPEDVVVVNRRDGESVREVGFGRLAGLAEGVLGGTALEGGGCRRRAGALIWVVVVCEGRTERDFVMQILGPELADSNVFVEARLIPTSPKGKGGALSGQRVLRFLSNALRQRGDTHVTTFFDLYGLPSDFPGFTGSPPDPLDRAAAIEASLHKEVVRAARCRPHRFLPHIQPYEFEALLFSDTSHFAREQREWEQGTDELAAARRGAASPEHINDGPDTHPSARLERLSGYRKVRDGTAVARRIGLDRIRRECAHFAEWVARLESLPALG